MKFKNDLKGTRFISGGETLKMFLLSFSSEEKAVTVIDSGIWPAKKKKSNPPS